MKILRINHLGIAPKDPALARSFLSDVLGLPASGSEVVEGQKVRVDFFSVDDSRLEILEPTTQDSPIAKYIETRGGGIQHVALEVDDLDAWLSALKAKGIKLIDAEAKTGAHKTRVAFIHPHAAGGLLIELVQETHP